MPYVVIHTYDFIPIIFDDYYIGLLSKISAGHIVP